MHAFKRYRKHQDILSCWPSHTFICAMLVWQPALILHMSVENAGLDPAMSLHLHEQTVVAGLRKTIGECDLRRKFPVRAMFHGGVVHDQAGFVLRSGERRH